MIAGLKATIIRFIALCLLLGGYVSAVSAEWVRVTCKNDYQYSESETAISCFHSDTLEGKNGYFIPGFSRAKADRNTGSLSIGSGGGYIRNIGFNGGESTAYLRKSFGIDNDWTGWLPVTVDLIVRYFFVGYGESQLKINLSTHRAGDLNNVNRAGVILHYDGFEHANLVHSMSKGRILIPKEGVYAEDQSLTLSATHWVHHTMPTLDVRVDLLAWSFPHLRSLGSRISASVEADAWLEISSAGGEAEY